MDLGHPRMGVARVGVRVGPTWLQLFALAGINSFWATCVTYNSEIIGRGLVEEMTVWFTEEGAKERTRNCGVTRVR